MTGTKVTFGFGENSAFPRSNADCMASRAQQLEPCSPEMEGPIELVPPELPEDTLMEVSLSCSLFLSLVTVCHVDYRPEDFRNFRKPVFGSVYLIRGKRSETFRFRKL